MSDDFVELGDGEVEIPADDSAVTGELLFRQIPDHSWDSHYGRPGSESFGPMPIDKGMPSFSRGSIVTAQQSRDWHNENARSKSRGVWACTVDEVTKAGTRSVDDSDAPIESDHERAPGHAFVDYRHISSKSKADKRARKDIKAQLLMNALDRKEIPTVDNP